MSNAPKEHFWGLGAHLEYSLRYVSRACDISFENSLQATFIVLSLKLCYLYSQGAPKFQFCSSQFIFLHILLRSDKSQICVEGLPVHSKIMVSRSVLPSNRSFPKKPPIRPIAKALNNKTNLIQNLCRPVIHKVIDREKTNRCCHTSLWFQCGYDFYYF